MAFNRKNTKPVQGKGGDELADSTKTRQHGFTRKHKLNTSLVSMAHTAYLTCKVRGAMYDAPMPTLARNEDGTIPCVPIINLEDGELCTLIVPAVFRSILQGEHDYIGKCYELIRGEVVQGKNYRQIEVWEIDDPTPGEKPLNKLNPLPDDYETGN